MRAAMTLALVLMTPALTQAQQADAEAGTSASATASVATSAGSVGITGDGAADTRIDAAFARAEGAGLTTAGLEARVRRGSARGVEAARVASAVEQRVDAMLAARDALRVSGESASDVAVELGADAIESGASAAHVTRVATSFDGDTRYRALATLADLAAANRIGSDVVASVRSELSATAAGAGSAGSAAATATSAGSAAGAGLDATTRASAGIAGSAASASAAVTATVGGALPR